MPKALTISIVTYNGSEIIGPCLDALKKQTFQDFDVIVIDNASQDNSCRIAAKHYPQAKMISNLHNIGFGSAHNLAIGLAQTPWVMLLNTDLELASDAIEKMMMATSNPQIAAIGPRLYQKNDGSEIIDSVGLSKTSYLKVFEVNRNKKITQKLKQSQEMWGISGACVMYRKFALEQIAYHEENRIYPQYFDELFFMYKEDVDLSARLQKAGWKSWYQANAIGYHDRSGRAADTIHETKSHRDNLPDYIHLNSYRNHLFFVVKNAKLWQLPLVAAYEVMKFFYLLVFETRTLKALKAFPAHLPQLIKKRYAK